MRERDGIYYHHSSRTVRGVDAEGFRAGSATETRTELHLSEEDLAKFSDDQLDALFPSGFFCGVSVRALAARGRAKAREYKRQREIRELAAERGLRLVEGPKPAKR